MNRARRCAAQPLSYTEGEVEAFVVKLVSKESYRYDFRLDFGWFDATNEI